MRCHVPHVMSCVVRVCSFVRSLARRCHTSTVDLRLRLSPPKRTIQRVPEKSNRQQQQLLALLAPGAAVAAAAAEQKKRQSRTTYCIVLYRVVLVLVLVLALVLLLLLLP